SRRFPTFYSPTPAHFSNRSPTINRNSATKKFFERPFPPPSPAKTITAGDNKGQQVAVKVILKEKMKTAIAIEDVSREVKILRALSGHDDLLYFYDAY
uniref:Protein kinase domain-containing protein n=1 Tax=Brassica oleracea var. oleracea TaxID=109376 RepID=A0A0D3CYU6_BRAOL